MDKYTRLFEQTGEEEELKKLKNLRSKAILAVDSFINNAQIKTIDKETELDKLNLRFVKGDTTVLQQILDAEADIQILKDEEQRAMGYKARMFEEEKK